MNTARILIVSTPKQTFRVKLKESKTLFEIYEYLFRRTSKRASCTLRDGIARAYFN